MKYFSDVSMLHSVLRELYEKVSPDERRDTLANLLEDSAGFSPKHASLFASTVLIQNVQGSADFVILNTNRISDSWVRGEQDSGVGLAMGGRTTKETWKFNVNLTYEHKIETHEMYATTGPFFRSSFSQPSRRVEQGIWAPPDMVRDDDLDLFVMSSDGTARQMSIKWVTIGNAEHQGCFIDRQRFGREIR